MPILADMHVHSRFSADAKDNIKDMCQAAIAKGVKYLAFTEHVDMNPQDTGYGYFDPAQFSQTIDELRKEFTGEIEILKGIEFGEPHRYQQELQKIAEKDFDVILGGVHCIGDCFMGDPLLIEKVSHRHIFELYYQEVLQTVRCGGFDVLAHLDFPKRYLKISYYNIEDIKRIMEELVRADIALEINTSSRRKGLDECIPDLMLVDKYMRAGGYKITIGSDAHTCEDIAADFQYAYEILSQVGTIQNGIFKKRKFISLT